MSGLLPGLPGESPGVDGEGDRRVQAYNYRLCLTNVPENRRALPVHRATIPASFYEILLRYIEAGGKEEVLGNPEPMPNRKSDTNNNGAFSTDDIGMNYGYPEADYATREKIDAEHRDYQLGLMWTIANDPRVPGLDAKEVLWPGGWREGRVLRITAIGRSSYTFARRGE